MKKRKFDKVIDKYLAFQKNGYSPDEKTFAVFDNPSLLVWKPLNLRIESQMEFLYSVLMFWHTEEYKHLQRMIDAMHIYYIGLYKARREFNESITLLSLPFDMLFMDVFSNNAIKENMIDLAIEIIPQDKDSLYPNYVCIWKIVAFLYRKQFSAKVEKIEQYLSAQTLDVYDGLLKDLLLSDDEAAIDNELSAIMKFRNSRMGSDSHITNPYFNSKWECFPIELLALIRYRYIQGKSIDFISNEVLQHYIPYIKSASYEVSPNIVRCIDEVHKNKDTM